MGFSLEGGGLVRINGEIFSFISDPKYLNRNFCLGFGRFGVVKLLQSLESKSQMALKVLKKESTEPGRTPFCQELEIAAALGRGFPQLIQKIKIGDSENKNASI